jgi:hypothetical protein
MSTAESIIWGLMSFVGLIVYLRWMGPVNGPESETRAAAKTKSRHAFNRSKKQRSERLADYALNDRQ